MAHTPFIKYFFSMTESLHLLMFVVKNRQKLHRYVTKSLAIKREWPLIITHSFHVKITLLDYFSSEKKNGGTEAGNLSLS